MKIVFKINSNITISHLKSVASTDTLRPVMCGACVDVVNQKLVLTDSHILIAYPIEIISNDTDIDHLIVPLNLFNRTRYMGEFSSSVLKVLDVEYILTSDYAEAVFQNELLYRTKYIEGKYPKWENVMPKEEDKLPVDQIGVNPKILIRLFKAFPNKNPLQFKMSLFAANKAILFEEINPESKSIITAIAMPINLNK